MLGNLKRFHILLGGWLQLKSARLIGMFRDENLHLNIKVLHSLTSFYVFICSGNYWRIWCKDFFVKYPLSTLWKEKTNNHLLWESLRLCTVSLIKYSYICQVQSLCRGMFKIQVPGRACGLHRTWRAMEEKRKQGQGVTHYFFLRNIRHTYL